MLEKKLKVDIARQPYDIVIGEGTLSRAGEFLASALDTRKVCIVTDETVAQLYLKPLIAALEAQKFMVAPSIILPAGEDTKSFHNLQYIVEEALGHGLDRHSALIALGGGVVGDITGFAASIIMRGIPFVQIPTTLMAQVDSAVGGKTGINTQQGKNLAGAFHQPKIVLTDIATLKTLPLRELKAGYAEILKQSMIDTPDFFSWLDKNGARLLAGDAAALEHAIAFSCEAKAGIVAADEHERKDIRALLNLGHTFAHAFEALGGYDGRLLHGEAVAVGLLMAADFSVFMGLCPAAEAEKISRHAIAMGLMTQLPFDVTAEEVLMKMRGDKKNRSGKMGLVLLRGIGQAYVDRMVDETALATFLQQKFG